MSIDFSDNEELQEVTQMHGLGMSILMDGYREGCEDGHQEGREKLLIELVCKKLRRQKSVETIADELEEDEERIRRICKAAQNYAPEYDSQQIYEELKMQ
jgi:predicted transposase YdaD